MHNPTQTKWKLLLNNGQDIKPFFYNPSQGQEPVMLVAENAKAWCQRCLQPVERHLGSFLLIGTLKSTKIITVSISCPFSFPFDSPVVEGNIPLYIPVIDSKLSPLALVACCTRI